jgi:hypothetical protein
VELGHDRLALMRQIDEGRTLVALGRADTATGVLHEALGTAGAKHDVLCQFHAHFYLWKAYTLLKQQDRAELELQAAQYHSRFLDDKTPESEEIRQTMRSPKR